MQWIIKIDEHQNVIDLFETEAPNSLEAILNILPFKIDLHYAKIAGQEVYGMIPLILPLENAKKVGDLGPGTVAYYPDRQMFCIYHGSVQPEDAMVTVLGHLRPDPVFFDVLESVKTRRSVFLNVSETNIFQTHPHKIFAIPGNSWNEFWEKPTKEILDLTSKKGHTMPSGPILSAYGDSLKLVGVLWELRKLLVEKNHFDEISFIAIVRHFQEILGGWYGLRDVASAIEMYVEHICKTNEKLIYIEEMILFSGRLHMWLDALIPWEEINEQFIKKYQ